MRTVLTRGFAALLGLLPIAVLAIGTAPASVSGSLLDPPPEPQKLDLSTLPPELGSLRLDGRVSRGPGVLPQRCGELVPLARTAAQEEPQRPGPWLVIHRCARATGDSVAAADAFARLRERVEASLAPPGIWQGDAYYYGVGTLDVAAVVAALADDAGSGVIASALEVSDDGYRVHELVWLRSANGRVRRVRVDVTPSAERVMRHLANTLDDTALADTYVAIAGSLSVNLRAGQLAAESHALVGRARIALRTGYYGGAEQARKDLERAIAQDDAFARYVQAEWLLADKDADATTALALLRRASEQGLPEAQALLALWCERHKDCRRGEAKTAQAAAVRAYGEAEVALLRHEAARRLNLGDGARDLESALTKGSLRALALRIRELAGSSAASKRETREREALLRRGVDAGLPYALEIQALTAYAQTKTADERAAARVLLERAATLGSARAATQLGASYASGDASDRERAQPWHRLAAERGEATGQFNFASALLAGRGATADPAAARLWYLRSAMQGFGASLRALGDLHARGEGVVADSTRAVQFYAAAARRGDARGQYLYALALDLGDGVAKDRDAARSWYERAAAQGSGEATLALAHAELKTATPEAGIARLEACAANGDAGCRLMLADALVAGPERLRDLPRALVLYEQSADAGDARALSALGTIYLRGIGVAADRMRGIAYYARCIDREGDGVAACLVNLGRAYLTGFGIAEDHSRAREILQRARELGSADATCLLGDIAQSEGDADVARSRYAEAAAEGSARCMRQYALKLLYVEPKQPAAGMDWLRKADAAGEPEARGAIVAALLQSESAVYDKAAGLAYAETCVSEAAYQCVTIAGSVLLRDDDASVQARALAWLERAAQHDDADAARVLGGAAYYGYGRKRDAAMARHWLLRSEPVGLSAVQLARLDAAAGDDAGAHDRLLREAAGGNVYAQLVLLERCAQPGAECGKDAPTETAWLANLERRGETQASELLNEVTWALATDPHATAAEARRLVALAPKARYALADDVAHRDTWAALLARAGRYPEACRLQRKLVDDVRRLKAAAEDLREFEQHRDAFCAGRTWDRFD